jgi:hypothetical protein
MHRAEFWQGNSDGRGTANTAELSQRCTALDPSMPPRIVRIACSPNAAGERIRNLVGRARHSQFQKSALSGMQR